MCLGKEGGKFAVQLLFSFPLFHQIKYIYSNHTNLCTFFKIDFLKITQIIFVYMRKIHKRNYLKTTSEPFAGSDTMKTDSVIWVLIDLITNNNSC